MCDNAFAQTAVSINARFLLGFSCVVVCVFVSECALLSMSVSSCAYFDVFVLKGEFLSCAGLLGLLGFSCVLVCVFVSECALLSMSVSSCVYFEIGRAHV